VVVYAWKKKKSKYYNQLLKINIDRKINHL
jgi:hypothetical protein